jgi:NAD(P)-dependent dehydrogenase (short-subunit alcohol dehydrogenase family)
MRMGLLEGHRAIITGGGSGIGAAAARRFHAEGATVAVLDRDAASAAAVAAEVEGIAITVDVADTDATAAAVQAAAEQLGGLDDLFANAGVGNLKRLDAYREREWDLLVDVNLKGTFNCLRAAVPLLLAGYEADGRPRSVVTMASVSGVRPTRGEAPYSAAKAGIIALTRSTALEYGPGLRANCISPGFIHTPLTDFAAEHEVYRPAIDAGTPLGRAGRADEVADVAVFLCSTLASYVSGHNLVVDGGSLLPSSQSDPMLSDLLGGGPS